MNNRLRKFFFFTACLPGFIFLAANPVNAQGGGDGGRNRAPRITSTPRVEAVEGSE